VAAAIRTYGAGAKSGPSSADVAEQVSVYSSYIESELRAERDRKAVIDTRAASLVTTSGSLVTILAAVGTFLGKEALADFPKQLIPLLVLALFSFTFASLAGICSGWNRPHDTSDTGSMKACLQERWNDEEVLARVEVADVQIRMIDKLRAVNEKKELFLRAGWICQVVAMGLLAIVVLILLATR
jgi:hypothetical protein